jgi:NADPH2:quinone reductase
MRAVVMPRAGEPEVLQITQVPPPEIQSPTELLVRIRAAGVNPIDTKLRQRGTFYPEALPAILGCDGAGIVEAVGEAVTKFKVGDAVYFCHGGLGKQQGNYAEMTVIEEEFAALMPRNISFAEAGAAPLVLITAWESLFDRARLEAGRKVLIHGGAGGVGHVAMQLAHLKGAEVAVTVSSPAKAELCQRLCPTVFPILYRQENFVSAVMRWTDGEGVDMALDTVGGKVFQETFTAVQVYGDLVTILAPSSDTDWKTARDRNLRISLELMLTPMLTGQRAWRKHQAQILAECAQLLENGKLKVHVDRQLPLAEAAQAHRLLSTGQIMGKLVLIP